MIYVRELKERELSESAEFPINIRILIGKNNATASHNFVMFNDNIASFESTEIFNFTFITFHEKESPEKIRIVERILTIFRFDIGINFFEKIVTMKERNFEIIYIRGRNTSENTMNKINIGIIFGKFFFFKNKIDNIFSNIRFIYTITFKRGINNRINGIRNRFSLLTRKAFNSVFEIFTSFIENFTVTLIKFSMRTC